MKGVFRDTGQTETAERLASNNRSAVFHPLTGRPVGSVEFRGRPYAFIDSAKKWAAEFLSTVTKQTKGETMAATDTNEKTNMVFLAGIVQMSKIETERVFFTLDVGMKQWVPCSVYKNPEIQDRLKGLYKGDFVQVKAILRPWSKKMQLASGGEEWERGLTVEITEVKTIVKGSGAPVENKKDALPF